MGQRIQPAVFGATGYSGFELVRLLARHDGVKKPLLFSRNGDSGATRPERGLSADRGQRRISVRELLVAADERCRCRCVVFRDAA